MMRRWVCLSLFSAVAFAQITVIPNASTTGVVVGPGYVKAQTHQVVRTAADVVYIFAVDDSGCLKNSAPTTGVIRGYKGSGSQAAQCECSNYLYRGRFRSSSCGHHQRFMPVQWRSYQYDIHSGCTDGFNWTGSSRLHASADCERGRRTLPDIQSSNRYVGTYHTARDEWTNTGLLWIDALWKRCDSTGRQRSPVRYLGKHKFGYSMGCENGFGRKCMDLGFADTGLIW